MKWRPIKTAPKDRLILLSCDEHPELPGYVCVGRWIDIPHFNQRQSLWSDDGRLSPNIKTMEDLNRVAKEDAHWMDGYPGILSSSDGHRVYELRGNVLFCPTHWMPLPLPPGKRRQRAQKEWADRQGRTYP